MAKNNCPRGMYEDEEGTYRFIDPGTAPVTMKQWFWGEVIRSVSDEKTKGRVSKKQTAQVFAHEADVAGFIMKQCPSPWPVSEYDDVKVKISYGLMNR
jgi:hypothetical protein